MHLDVAAQQEPLLLPDAPILQRHVLHLEQQNRGLHLNVSREQEPVLGWTCLYHRGLSRFQEPVLVRTFLPHRA